MLNSYKMLNATKKGLHSSFDYLENEGYYKIYYSFKTTDDQINVFTALMYSKTCTANIYNHARTHTHTQFILALILVLQNTIHLCTE